VNLEKGAGTEQSEDRFNQSQELLMSKYNRGGEDDDEPETFKEKVVYNAWRLYFWGRRNPLKVIIIALSIINFALILTAPLKDLAIEGYPQKFDEMQAVIDGLKLKSADVK
jgi:hypothetical protein